MALVVAQVAEGVEDPPVVVVEVPVVVDETPVVVAVVVLEGVEVVVVVELTPVLVVELTPVVVEVAVVVVELPRPVVVVEAAVVLLPKPMKELELEPICLRINGSKSATEAKTWPVKAESKRLAIAAVLNGEPPKDVNFMMKKYSNELQWYEKQSQIQRSVGGDCPRMILMRR
jgi:hypothetical protein